MAPNVYYSGSPESLDFGESGEHGFMMVDVEGERRRVQFVPFSQREYRQLSVQVGENDSEMSISDRIASAIIREDPHHIDVYKRQNMNRRAKNGFSLPKRFVRI